MSKVPDSIKRAQQQTLVDIFSRNMEVSTGRVSDLLTPAEQEQARRQNARDELDRARRAAYENSDFQRASEWDKKIMEGVRRRDPDLYPEYKYQTPLVPEPPNMKKDMERVLRLAEELGMPKSEPINYVEAAAVLAQMVFSLMKRTKQNENDFAFTIMQRPNGQFDYKQQTDSDWPIKLIKTGEDYNGNCRWQAVTKEEAERLESTLKESKQEFEEGERKFDFSSDKE